jgi:hypothetical protein
MAGSAGGNETPDANYTAQQNKSTYLSSTTKKPELKVKAPRSPKEKKTEEVPVDLESPTSVIMKGSFLLKQADAQFEYFFNQIKRKTKGSNATGSVFGVNLGLTE